jgi:lipoprotein NlpD
MDLGGEVGSPVRASRGGEVVYSGNGLVGYGELIIIKHDDRYLSAYGFNQSRLVAEGEAVNAGQVIARMGTGPDNQAMLHFEVRDRGKPIDPIRVLPDR